MVGSSSRAGRGRFGTSMFVAAARGATARLGSLLRQHARASASSSALEKTNSFADKAFEYDVAIM